MKTLLTIIFGALAIGATARAPQECVSVGDNNQACCADGNDIGERTVFVMRSKNALTDVAMDMLTKISGTQSIALVREGDLYWIGWKFGEMERPVFIIDDDHRTLPGFVRLGTREARKFQWKVIQKTMLQFELSGEEFLAAKEGMVVRVENTWIEPFYQHTLDFSCAAAWKLLKSQNP